MAGRNLFLFTDGTGNAGGKTRNTNVYRLFRAIDRNGNAPQQLTFYDDGVGTSDNSVSRMLGNVFGYGLSRNISEMYEWLVLHYEPCDRVFILGFSRGAFTARCLAGLIKRCGVLKKEVYLDSEHLSVDRRQKRLKEIVWAYRAIHDGRFNKWRGESKDFYDVRTHFVGVWDTVDAVGMPIDELRPVPDYFTRLFRGRRAYAFRDMMLRGVEHARHAISIDDERRTFHPNVWYKSPSKEMADHDSLDCGRQTDPANIRQVWFAGAHSNVGGGYPKDQLAHVTLDWMMGELEAIGDPPECRVRFISGKRKAFQDEADAHGRHYDPRTGPAVYYRYSPRRITRFYKGTGDIWERVLKLRFLKLPALPRHGIEIHASVFQRIVRGTQGYTPLFLPDKGDTDFKLAIHYTQGSGPYTEANLGAQLATAPAKVAAVARSTRTKISALVTLRQITYSILLLSTLVAIFQGFNAKPPNTEMTATNAETWTLTGASHDVIIGLVPDLASPLVDAAFAYPIMALLYGAIVAGSWGLQRVLKSRIHAIGRRAYDA